MNTLEAFNLALNEGKKIRRVSWKKECYVYYNPEDGFLWYSFSSGRQEIWKSGIKLDREDWETYKLELKPGDKFKFVGSDEVYLYLGKSSDDVYLNQEFENGCYYFDFEKKAIYSLEPSDEIEVVQ